MHIIKLSRISFVMKHIEFAADLNYLQGLGEIGPGLRKIGCFSLLK